MKKMICTDTLEYEFIKNVLLSDYDYTVKENLHQYYNYGKTIKTPGQESVIAWFDTMCKVFSTVQACNIVRKSFSFARHTQVDCLDKKEPLAKPKLKSNTQLNDGLPF